ncbi:stage V sporulation protein AC [Congzhengia sp.]|uniref:stage V sporulation protein AC n=1 Tax=Congzhengia sp. TaxID=2944168 RepID=UPI0030782219
MKNNMTDKQYQDYVDKKTPNSPIVKDVILAFIVGGLICVIGQLILNGYQAMGFDEEGAAMGTSTTLVFLGAFFTGLGLYDRLAKFAGAGSIVPITGFANSIVSPAMEFKSEGLVLGLAVKMFTVAGPVLVYGITSSVVAGIVYYIMSFF